MILFHFRACIKERWLLKTFWFFSWFRSFLLKFWILRPQNIKWWNCYIMIDEKSAWNAWLIFNFGNLIKLFFPQSCFGDRWRIRSVGDYYAPWDMSCVEWLESGIGIDVGSLIPELNSDFLTLYCQNFQAEIGIFTHFGRIFILLNSVSFLLLTRTYVRFTRWRAYYAGI